MNPLTNIPADVRGYLYLASALIGLALGATQVGFQAAEAGFPTWLKVALSVYAFLAGTLGLTAASNMQVRDRDERGATVPGFVWILAAVALVLIVLALVGINVNVRA